MDNPLYELVLKARRMSETPHFHRVFGLAMVLNSSKDFRHLCFTVRAIAEEMERQGVKWDS